MQDNEKMLPEEESEVSVFTLTDEETGEQLDFALLAEARLDGQLYYALEPMAEIDDDEGEYVILKVTEDGDDAILETVEDDEVFEKLEDYFNDLFFGTADYDAE